MFDACEVFSFAISSLLEVTCRLTRTLDIVTNVRIVYTWVNVKGLGR